MQTTPFIMPAKAVALAALLATTATASMAQTGPLTSSVFYGRIDTALEFNNDGKQDRTAIQNFSSRFGFKGEREFNGDLSGIFQVETGIAPDDTTQSKTLASRNSYIGLQSKSLGRLIMGTHDMPLKSLEGNASQTWGEGDLMELVIHGKASRTGINGGTVVFNNVHTRKTNMVMYTSPKYMNIVAKVAFSPDEAQTATNNKAVHGGSVEFNDGTYNFGVAYENQLNVSANGGSMTGVKVTGGVKMGDISVGAAYSNIDNNAGPVNGRKTDNYLLTGAYTMGPIVLKAAFAQSSSSGATGKDDGLSASTIEVDYSLDKQVTLYSYYSSVDNNKDAKGSFAAADNFPAAAAAGNKPNAFGLGIRYNF
jgi:predicted porin